MRATTCSGKTESTVDGVDAGCTTNNNTTGEVDVLRSALTPMKLKRTLALGVVGAALVAWFAAASTTGNRPVTHQSVPQTTRVEMRGAELAAEIARLRERLHPTAAPQAPVRNLFEFSRTAAFRRPAADSRPAVTDEPVPPPAPAPPTLRLVGIAEDAGPDGPVRTAIISGFGRLFFAKPGERVTDRYEVARISGEAAELKDLGDNSSITLVLK